ncbi:MAG: radical SAM/SPASM domain-containing protein [Parcubacteria group bacterium]|jgi:MoaA/NifB/PqqE/SkfB family radical SAM enzyme
MTTKAIEKNKEAVSSLKIFGDLLNGYAARSIGYLASTSAAKAVLTRLDARIYKELMSKEQYPKKVQEEKYFMGRNLILTILKSLENAKGSPNVQKALVKAVKNVFLDRKSRVAKFEEKFGHKPPAFLVIGPGKFCNLSCEGCYANSSATNSEKLEWDVLDRIMEEKEELWGSYFTVITGGEPLLYKSQGKTLLDLAKKHSGQFFLMFTNGTMIDKAMAKKLQEVGNITPAISVEGFEKETDARRGEGTHKKIIEAMANLREVGVPFGISLTATHNNAELVGGEKLYDYYFGKHGAVYAWIFQLMPIGRADSLGLMVDANQRVKLYRSTQKLAKEKEMFIADFWNNGCLSDGCISAGRPGGYLYIEWNGNVTPCVFNPYSPVNINDIYENKKNLNNVLDEPFFEAIRQWQKDYALDRKPSEMGNWLLPCPIKDHYSDMRKLIDKYKPNPIDEASEQALLDDNYKIGLEKYDREVATASDPIWEKEYLGK